MSSNEFSLSHSVLTRLLKTYTEGQPLSFSKESKSAFARSCQIFVSFLTTCALEYTAKTKRQTLFTEDVLKALDDLGFDEIVEVLESDLGAFRKMQKGKKQAASAERDASKSLAATTDDRTSHDREDAEGDGEDGGTEDEQADDAPAGEEDGDAGSDDDGGAAGDDQQLNDEDLEEAGSDAAAYQEAVVEIEVDSDSRNGVRGKRNRQLEAAEDDDDDGVGSSPRMDDSDDSA